MDPTGVSAAAYGNYVSLFFLFFNDKFPKCETN